VTSHPPHHRLHVQGRHAHLTFAIEATLRAPWTILFGPSGSGKSTLLRALAGLVPALTVSFERFQPSTQGWEPLQQVPIEKRKLAYDPQNAILLPHLTALENLRFPERVRRLKLDGSLIPELTALLQLEPLLPKRPHQLSGGERQRISLARALAVPDARLLLLDEPFAGLDRSLRDELLPPLIAHLTARNLPVLSVTHDPDEALLLKAEVLRLHNGQLTAQGSAQTVLADEIARLAALLPKS
jgi:molybdate transport system ATP-binding protein